MANEIQGNSGANLLTDTAAAEVIRGYGGNDTLLSVTNFDTLYGGYGKDLLRVSQPSAAYLHAVAFGDRGDDTIRMTATCDSANLFGGDGADRIFGTGKSGYFTGGTGDDQIYGGPDATHVTNRILAYGDAGNDVLTGIWNAFGGDGDDVMTACHLASGGNGHDTVGGTALGDFLSDDGTDALSNVFFGRAGSDQITGGLGSDRIEGGYNADTIWGGYGDDLIYGGYGRDEVYGGFGQDHILGDSRRDRLFGDAGDDTLSGGIGSDTLLGGAGRDVMWGGDGADHFVFLTASETGVSTGADVIWDFVSGQDRIKLAFGGLHFIGTTQFSNTAGEVRFEASAHRLQVDLDGNGTTDAAIQLVGVTHVGAGDLIL